MWCLIEKVDNTECLKISKSLQNTLIRSNYLGDAADEADAGVGFQRRPQVLSDGDGNGDGACSWW